MKGIPTKEDTTDYFKQMEEHMKPESKEKKKKGKYKQAEMEMER